MRQVESPEDKRKLSEALAHMGEALSILDHLEAPGEIGSQLDLAISRLESFLGVRKESPSALQILMAQVEREMTISGEPRPLVPIPWEMSPS